MKKYLILALTVFTITLLGLQTNADEPNQTAQPVSQENCATKCSDSNINDSAKKPASDGEYVRHIKCNCYKYDQGGCRKFGAFDEKWTKYNKNDGSKSDKVRKDK